jgi:hypothetical protein
MVYTPSMYAHTLSGIVLAAGILYLMAYNAKIMSKDPYQIVVLILLFSIAISIHGLSHLGLETVYNYNPLSLLTGNYVEPYHPADCPYRKACNCPYRRMNYAPA